MADPISLLAAPVIEKITKDAYKFGNKKYNEVYGVTVEIENLQSYLTAISAVLTDAERCSRKPEQLTDWLTKLRAAALDAEDMLGTYATEAALREMKNHPAPFDWLTSRLNAANNIKKIVGKMEHISRQRNQLQFKPEDYGGEWTDPTTWIGLRETNARQRTNEVVGRDDEKENIVSWLLSSEEASDSNNWRVPVLTITGMAGLGKTTLAQLVYNDERINKKGDETCRFKNAVWVNVSMDFSVERILKEMVERLTDMVHDKVSRTSVESGILKVLDGKPFFLVLDDVWVNERLDWEDLQNFLITCPRGSKVLVTSRDNKVAARLGATLPYNLSTLNEDHCWDLFSNEVLLSRTSDLGDDKKEKEEIGREIIRNCNFLPLAVKAMAAILRGKILRFWKRIQRNGVWKTDAANQGVGASHILPALKLSYDHLPSSLLKQCFAFCSIFPNGHMFDKDELVKLWIAEGFIMLPDGEDTLEEVGGDYFDELHGRSFFQLLDIDNKERFKMHDLIHDLAISISIASYQVEENKTHSIQHDCRHVSFLCKDVQKPALEILTARKLRTLLLPVSDTRDFGKTLNKMFQTLRYMRVLDLSSSTIIELPKSIKELKLLHYLDLSRTEIRLVPKGICKLLNLQILKLLGCLWLQELPKDLGNLKDLRYLELDDIFWYKCSKLPPRLGGLTGLHNLHRFLVHCESGYGIEELKNMNRLEGMLHISKLENSGDAKEAQLQEKAGINKLILEWSEEDANNPQDRILQESILNDLEPHSGLQELHIRQYKGGRFSSWLGNGVLQNLRKISLDHCVNCKILSLGPLPHLQHLTIKGMLELEEWLESTTSYRSLNRLTISNCPKLWNLPQRSLCSLVFMKIKQCHALKALPLTPYLQFLTLINNDLLEDWSEVPMAIIVDRNHEGPDVLRSPQNLQGNNNILQEDRILIVTKEIGGLEDGLYMLASFFKLLELKMVNCLRLQNLPLSFAPQKLKISGCPLLTTLPTQQNSQRLQYLELDKFNGASLLDTMQSAPSLDALTISNVTNISSLPKLPHLPKLRSLYIHNCQNLVSLLHEDGLLTSFTSLNFLSISGCQKLLNFPEALPASIQCLIIKSCSELKSLHAESRNYLTSLTSLQELYLEDCSKLEFLPEDGIPASLSHLRIRGCPVLTQKCKEDVGGRYWQMISHVVDLELDFINTLGSEPSPTCCFK